MNIKFIVAVFAVTSIIGGLSYRWKSKPYTRYRLPTLTNDDKLTGRILNGHDAYSGELPYQLYLKMVKSTRKVTACGGVLVETYNVQFALTAAHCVHDGYPTPFSTINPKNIRITAGAHNLKRKSGAEQVRIPTKVVVHEQYDFYSDIIAHDIAILFYDTPFKYNGNVSTIQLPEYMWAVPERVEISGWGLTSAAKNATQPKVLQVAEMRTVSTTYCKHFEYEGNVIDWRRMCLIDETGIGSCLGDSGGPAGATNSTNAQWYLAGLLSYHIGPCGSGVYPVVNTRVSAYIDWIHIQVNEYINHLGW